MTDQLDCALDIMRRLPPSRIEDNLADLIDLLPDLAEDLLSSVDQPLKIAHDKAEKKDYLLCEYNRDGDSYRSPWSNKYDPPLPDGNLPNRELRALEVQGNEIFDIYREMYFEGGVSSLYCWESTSGGKGFAAVILIKKTQDQSKKGQPMKGTWDSIHVAEVAEKKGQANYKLTSTVMLSLETQTEQTGQVSLAGSLTRQEERDFPVNEANPHLINLGRMIEDMEIRLRNTIEIIYFGKTKDIANMLRQSVKVSETRQKQLMQKQIGGSIGRG
jgi:capping protein beta